MRRRALTAVVLSFAALALATGASFLVYHGIVDVAGSGGCGGG